MDALVMGAADFLGNFTNTLGQLYNQANTDETRRQEQERESTMRVLQAAASSDSLNPEDYSVLLPQMLKLSGAKGKHIDAATQLMQRLFAPNTTYRGKKTVVTSGQGADVQIGDVPNVPQDSQGGIHTSPAQPEMMPPPPQMSVEPVYTPQVRFMSPQEKAQQEANSAAAHERALLPIYDEKNRIKTRGDLEEIDARNKAKTAETTKKLENSLLLIGVKDRNAVTLRQRQREQMYLSLGRTPDEAKQMAAELTLAELQSGIVLKQAQTKATLANAAAIPERVQQGWKRLEIEASKANSDPQLKVLNKAIQRVEDLRQRAIAASKKADEYGDETSAAQAESLRQQMRNQAQFIADTYEGKVKVWGLDDEEAWPYVEVVDASSVPDVPGAPRRPSKPTKPATNRGSNTKTKGKVSRAGFRQKNPQYANADDAMVDALIKGAGYVPY